MNELPESESQVRLPTLRDLAAPVFRYRRAGLLSAGAVMAATLLLVALAPKQYEAEMKLLVKRERADVIVSAEPGAAPQGQANVSEDEMNLEVEVLKGRDLLEEVALASGLVSGADGLPGSSAAGPSPVAQARAVRVLQKALRISPLRKTALIQVTYASRDPELAARVLRDLARLYLEKHLALHRPPGAYQFFSDQAERFHAEMTAAEARLKDYGRHEQVVSADTERETALRQLSEFEAAQQQTQAAVADANRRLVALEDQAASTPARQTMEIRTSDNAGLTGEFKARILELEMKRADLQRKFTPGYPPLVETEGQLAQARAALARTEQSPVREETTNQNPTHQWLASELARVRTERSAAIARVGAIGRSVQIYKDKARTLEEQSAVQQDLRRAIKTAEDNYLLYLRKQEEARISDALDRTRIANVVIAEAPIVPSLPSDTGRALLLTIGTLMACIVGLTVTCLLAYTNPYLQTPDDVEGTMGVPVLATVPARQ